MVFLRTQEKSVPPGLSEAAALNLLVGKKVRIRWPEDNIFYEAIITSYDPIKVLKLFKFNVNNLIFLFIEIMIYM